MTKFDRVLKEISELRDFYRKLTQTYQLPKNSKKKITRNEHDKVKK